METIHRRKAHPPKTFTLFRAVFSTITMNRNWQQTRSKAILVRDLHIGKHILNCCFLFSRCKPCYNRCKTSSRPCRTRSLEGISSHFKFSLSNVFNGLNVKLLSILRNRINDANDHTGCLQPPIFI